MRDERQYQRAYRKVKRKRGFIIHSIIFVFGSIFLFFTNLTIIYPYEPWFIAPVGVWALIIIMHALYAFTGLLTKEWEEQQIDKELRKLGDHDLLEEDEPLHLREIRKERRNDEDDYV